MTKPKGKPVIDQSEQTLTAFIKTLPKDMSVTEMFKRARKAGYRKTTKDSVSGIRRVLGIPSMSRSDAQKLAWAARKSARKHKTSKETNGATPVVQAEPPVLSTPDASFLEAVNRVGLSRATMLLDFIRSAKAVRS